MAVSEVRLWPICKLGSHIKQDDREWSWSVKFEVLTGSLLCTTKRTRSAWRAHAANLTCAEMTGLNALRSPLSFLQSRLQDRPKKLQSQSREVSPERFPSPFRMVGLG